MWFQPGIHALIRVSGRSQVQQSSQAWPVLACTACGDTLSKQEQVS